MVTYNANIPATNNRPSNDQGPMQTNFSSIQTLINVDHVDFADAAFGTHDQVTILSNNVPSPVLGNFNPTIFTNITSPTSTISQLFFYSGSAAQSSTQYSNAAANGSTMVLGGIILKWGSFNFANGIHTTDVTFGSPFPNAFFGAQLSLFQAVPMSADYVLSTSGAFPAPAQGGFAVFTSSSSSGTCYWLAIGN